MANKTIKTNAPNSVRGVQRRAEMVRRRMEHGVKQFDAFDTLVLDTMVGIAEGSDEPIETAREVMRCGAEVFDDPETWLSWDRDRA